MTGIIAATRAGRGAALALAERTDAQLTHAHARMLHYLHPPLATFGGHLRSVTPPDGRIPLAEAKGAAAGALVAAVRHHVGTLASEAKALITHTQSTASAAGAAMATTQLATYRVTPPKVPLPTPATVATDATDDWGDDAAAQTQRAIVAGVLLGRSPEAIVRDVNLVLAFIEVRAELTNRTATLGAFRGGALLTFRAVGSAGWIWFANLGRACGMCTAMHGTRHAPDETLDSHPNCNCQAVPLPPVDSDIPGPAIDLGSDWFADQSAAVQQGILSPTKYQAYHAGDLTLPDLVGVHHNARWGTSRYERSLKDLNLTPNSYR